MYFCYFFSDITLVYCKFSFQIVELIFPYICVCINLLFHVKLFDEQFNFLLSFINSILVFDLLSFEGVNVLLLRVQLC